MNPTSGLLAPEFTVPNLQQALTATRPVQVYTYVFGPEGSPTASAHSPSSGSLYPFPGISALPPHNHEHYEIALVTEGAAVHQTSAGAFEIARGDVLAIAPDEVHAFSRIQDLVLVNCTYLAEWLLQDVRELLNEEGLVPLFLHTALFSAAPRLQVPQWHVQDDELEACLGDFRDLAAERDRELPSHLFLKCSLKKIMIRLHRAFVASAEQTRLLAIHPIVRLALEQVEDHILQCTPFRVSELASDLNMSADYFSRSFKQATGWSPMDYFQRRRVQRACSLLLATSHSATEIAHTLGYCDAAHFSHLFKRHYGLSPSAYRRKYTVGTK